jgi:hypothetical protein
MDEMSILNSNIRSVEVEGFRISDEDRQLALRCFRGELSVQDAIDLIVSRA